MFNLDLYLFNQINGFAGKWQWLDYTEMFFAQYFEYFLWLCLFIFLVINVKKHWRVVIMAITTAVISRFVIAEIIRWIWFRPRPFVALNFIPLINQSPAEAAFPSAHASFYFALSTIIYLYNKKLGIFFLTSTFLITVARVFVGVHWPLDIVAGAIIGIILGLVINNFSKKYFNLKK